MSEKPPVVRLVVRDQTEQERKALAELLRRPSPPAGGAALRTGALLALVSVLAGCPGPKSPVDYEDASETPVEAKAGTPCQRAAKRLAELHCKESAPDFAQRCQELVDQKLPICAVKLSKIKACSEVDEVCR